LNDEIVRSDIGLFGNGTKRGREIFEKARLMRVGELELVEVVESETKIFKERTMRRSDQGMVFIIGSGSMRTRRTESRSKRRNKVGVDMVKLIIRRGRERFNRDVVRMLAITKRGELKNRGEKTRFVVVTFEKNFSNTMRVDDGVEAFNNLRKRKCE